MADIIGTILVLLAFLAGFLWRYNTEKMVVKSGAIPYLEYDGKHYPILHRDYNRLWVEDPNGELDEALGGDVVVTISLEKTLGTYLRNSDGTAFVTVWEKDE